MKRFVLTTSALLALGAGQATAATILLDFSGSNVYSTNDTDNQQTATGASATVELDFADVGNDVQITFSVINTTGDVAFGEGATQSTLTGFALDLLGDLTLLSAAPTLVSGATTALDTLLTDVFIGGISNGGGGAGNFGFALADNNNFVGGNANGGMDETESAIVTLLFGTAMTALETYDAYFAALFSTDPTVNAALRFQQVGGDNNYDGAGSDKLLFVPPTDQPPAPIPVPAAGLMLAAGLGGLLSLRRKRQS